MMMIKFLLVTVIVVMSTPISIYAERELMIKECHNAQVPTICMQCLESDPASLRADPLGIAGIVIHCLDSNLNTLLNNISKLLSKRKKGDAAIKTALKGCKSDLSEAITNLLPDANNGLETGDYDKAGQSVMHALGFTLSCRDNLQTAKFDLSPFSSQFNIYAQLSDAAMRIIDRF